MKTLEQISQQYNTDKKDHGYIGKYEHHFSPLRDRKLNVLEIGVGGYANGQESGESLRMWREYFYKSYIYGIDIFNKSHIDGDRIKTFMGSQSDEAFLRTAHKRMEVIDVIIDDGSHYNQDVIKSFTVLFPLMSLGGIYVIEDTQTSYWEKVAGIEWGGSENLYNPNTSMNFFKGLIDGLNYQEFTFNHVPNYFDKYVVSMHFYHNIVFIYKGENNQKSNIIRKAK